MNLDFTAPGARPGALSWLLLALGLAAVALASLAWRSADQAARDARAQIASLRAAPAKPARARAAADPAAQARQREEAEARQALARPWGRLLGTLQDTRPGDIAFLELDVDGRRGDFRIGAAARSQQAMLDYYRLLRAQPGLRAVSLERHELAEIDGIEGVRFSLRGEWSGP